MEKRFLEIEVVGYKWKDGSTVKLKFTPEEFIKMWHFPHENIKEVHVQIKKQSHVEELFSPLGRRKREFYASNGMELSSYDTPAYFEGGVVFVLGGSNGYEDFRYEFSYPMFLKVHEAVQEYNAFYSGDSDDKKEPKEENMQERFVELKVLEWETINGKWCETETSAAEIVAGYKNVNNIKFKIANQGLRESEFNPQNKEEPRQFHASNGIAVSSYSYPERSVDSNIIFVRGSVFSRDNTEIIVSFEAFKKIYEAVEEYNNLYKGEEMEKYLELEIVGKNEKFTAFYIKKQKLQGSNFKDFRASNGILLSSSVHTCFGADVLWVQGSNKGSHLAIMTADNKTMSLILEAVQQYNESFNNKELKESYSKVKSALNSLDKAASEFKLKAHQYDKCFCDNFNDLGTLREDIESIEEDL